MEIRHLTEKEASQVESLLRHMQISNPVLSWIQYPMGQHPNPIEEKDKELFLGEHYENQTQEQLNRIEAKVDALMDKLKFIFGDHTMVRGRFIDGLTKPNPNG